MVLTADSAWVSSDGGVTWQEKGSIKNIDLGLTTITSLDNGTITSGSITESRRLSSFSSQDIAYGDGKYLSVGSSNVEVVKNGSVTYYDNGTSVNWDNQSFWESGGPKIIYSTNEGASWQLIDNVSFSDPRGVT